MKQDYKTMQEQAIMNGTHEDVIPKHQRGEEIDFTKTPPKEEVDTKLDELTLEIKRLIQSDVLSRRDTTFILDYDELILECQLISEEFNKNPLSIINLIKNELYEEYSIKPILKFKNLSYEEEIANIRVEHIGKIVKVSGMLSNASNIMAITVRETYECSSCGTLIRVEGSNKPQKCSCGKRGGFKLIDKIQENSQDIVLEENQDEIGDRSPKRVRVRLLDNLCDKEMNGIVKDGNKIEIIGVVEAIPIKKDSIVKEELSYFRVNALQVDSLENEFDEDISEEDEKEIMEISVNNPLKQLADSLNPGIIGREMEKKALVLCSIGAHQKKTKKGRDRGRINMMLIGDASTGKTQLLQAICKKHYKAIYRGCERMTEAGLVGGADKDELTKTWGIKAGVLPKGNKGLIALDEMDKMPENIQKLLHTPMESGIVSLNFIGNSVNLNSDNIIISGANPKNSRFDRTKPLPPQINMTDTLLSRYTFIMAMKDIIDIEEDYKMAESIWEEEEDSILNKTAHLIPDNLFKKYLKYSQKFNPQPTNEAKKMLNDFYVEIRQKTQKSEVAGEAIPIVMRQLIGLKKIAEANARCRLSNELTKEDAKEAIELYKYSLEQLGMNLDDKVDFAKIGCLSEDTKIDIVENDKLKSKSLKELPQIFDVVSHNFEKPKNKKFEINQAKKINSGIKEVYEIEFENGEKVLATEDHIFFTNRGKEIQVKDFRVGLEIFSKKQKINLLVKYAYCSKEIHKMKIKKITKKGKVQTYDLQVKNTHNFFLSNGILSHNSGITLKVKEKRSTVLSFIKIKDEEKGFASSEELEEFAESKGMDKIELEKTLEDLKQEGVIFSPRHKMYRYLG